MKDLKSLLSGKTGILIFDHDLTGFRPCFPCVPKSKPPPIAQRVNIGLSCLFDDIFVLQ